MTMMLFIGCALPDEYINWIWKRIVKLNKLIIKFLNNIE
jgi:hypothetical protein